MEVTGIFLPQQHYHNGDIKMSIASGVGDGLGNGVSPAFLPNFKPTNISGCVLWLRADLGKTLNGSTVSQWNDQSSSGNNASQGTAANQPTDQPSDTPQASLLFSVNATDTTLNRFNISDSVSLHSGTGSYHLWAVIRTPTTYPTTHSIHGPIFDKNTASPWTGGVGDGFGLGINVVVGVGQPIVVFSGHTGTVNPGINTTTNTLYLLEYVYDGNGTHTIIINGVSTTALSSSTVTTPGNNTLVIGTTAAGINRSFAGNIFEQGINIPAPLSIQRTQLQNYVRLRYGVG